MQAVVGAFIAVLFTYRNLYEGTVAVQLMKNLGLVYLHGENHMDLCPWELWGLT